MKNGKPLLVFALTVLFSFLGLVKPPEAVSYCAPYSQYGEACYYMWIQEVVFNTIDNSSGCDEYADYSSKLSTDIKRNKTYDFGIVGYGYDQYYNVWIDFNQNGEFDKDELVIDGLYGYPDSYVSQSITIPSTAKSGKTVLRVISEYAGYGNASYDPCVITDYGEAEDYTVNIVSDPDAVYQRLLALFLLLV